MRYTTIIDISEYPSIYHNPRARLVYLHLALKAGYHEEDRDICLLSIRRLAADVGLTISATRHALAVLERAQLIERFGISWRVRKFVLSTPIPPRARSQRKQKEIEMRAYEEAQQKEREAREAAERAALAAERKRTGKSSFERFIEGLRARAAAGDPEAAASLRHWEIQLKNIQKKK